MNCRRRLCSEGNGNDITSGGENGVTGSVCFYFLPAALRLGAGVRDEAAEGDGVPAVPAVLRDGADDQVRAAVQPDLRREVQHGVHPALQDDAALPHDLPDRLQQPGLRTALHQRGRPPTDRLWQTRKTERQKEGDLLRDRASWPRSAAREKPILPENILREEGIGLVTSHLGGT